MTEPVPAEAWSLVLQWEGLIRLRSCARSPDELQEARLNSARQLARKPPGCANGTVAGNAGLWGVLDYRQQQRRQVGPRTVRNRDGSTRTFLVHTTSEKNVLDGPDPHRNAVTAEHEAATQELAAECLRFLDERSATILRLRFMEGQTLQQVGDRLGITKERVRQIELRAITKIQSNARLQRLADELNAEGDA